MKQNIMLGATGSIGIQTLDVIRAHPEEFELYAMAFGRNIDRAVPFIQEFKPELVVVQDESTKQKLSRHIDQIPILCGSGGLIEASVADPVDVVVNAVMGSIGLPATLKAIEARKIIAIANKETLVTAGHLVMEEARKTSGRTLTC